MDTDPGLLSDELVRAVESLADAFAARSIRHALIGGLAISMRGRPRLTQDVDFLLDVPQIALPGLARRPRWSAVFARAGGRHHGNIVREHITAFSFGPVRIDWLKPVLPFYSRALADAAAHWSGRKAIRSAWPRPRG